MRSSGNGLAIESRCLVEEAAEGFRKAFNLPHRAHDSIGFIEQFGDPIRAVTQDGCAATQALDNDRGKVLCIRGMHQEVRPNELVRDKWLGLAAMERDVGNLKLLCEVPRLSFQGSLSYPVYPKPRSFLRRE